MGSSDLSVKLTLIFLHSRRTAVRPPALPELAAARPSVALSPHKLWRVAQALHGYVAPYLRQPGVDRRKALLEYGGEALAAGASVAPVSSRQPSSLPPFRFRAMVVDPAPGGVRRPPPHGRGAQSLAVRLLHLDELLLSAHGRGSHVLGTANAAPYLARGTAESGLRAAVVRRSPGSSRATLVREWEHLAPGSLPILVARVYEKDLAEGRQDQETVELRFHSDLQQPRAASEARHKLARTPVALLNSLAVASAWPFCWPPP